MAYWWHEADAKLDDSALAIGGLVSLGFTDKMWNVV